ncbi:MAG TPA: translation initiation factor IF-3 [Candidatus Sumerlaeota bacterium]|nr:translation initiation factor IF-3 [Candidatus Sumerlaeota bacterium]HRU54684.1 translation initiation factor IF-3 [Candidatus Sumerlaeia bacterium]
MNEQIRVREVRLISEDGAQIGVVPIEQALKMAEEAGLDLVEVAETAKPPVCRIMDFNKLQYEKKRKAKESKKKAKQIQIKEVKFRPTIDPHDFATKAKKVREFLEEGNKVKLTLMFRGRQIVHANLGEKVLKDLVAAVSDVGILEGNLQLMGRFMGATLVAKAPPAAASKPSAPADQKTKPEK